MLHYITLHYTLYCAILFYYYTITTMLSIHYTLLFILLYLNTILFISLQLGANSGLHIIIFDELDAICKQRGTSSGSTGVHDTVVNQLLSKIDGVEQLNNILVIGE